MADSSARKPSDSDLGRFQPGPGVSSSPGAVTVSSDSHVLLEGTRPLRQPTEKDSRRRIDDEEQARQIADRDMNEPRKQTYSGLVLLWVAFQATGVIYGDIGTSPLYVFSATFTSHPSWDDLVGALSVIIWSLTLIVTVKYTFIVLKADDDGQGGAFALYTLLARHAHIISRQGPHAAPKVVEESESAGTAASRGLRRFLERSRWAQAVLKAVGVAGVALVMADGVLTPAQSVLGAVQGIRVADGSLKTPVVVGTSCAVLVLLFALQPLGTSRIGTAFAPVVTVWLLFNLCSGIYNLAMNDHTVLVAFSPHHAVAYLSRGDHGSGWRSLGGLLLAFTGVEALFADLGAFSRRAIQLSWLCLAYPCLLAAYCGQAAYISRDTTQLAFGNPFFHSVPPGTFYFSLVIAIMAAVVASQAMVTSVFQLLNQLMKSSFFPHIKKYNTSTRFHEQVYIPVANWGLMIGSVIVTAAYNNTTSLGNAYGTAVILVSFVTTCLVALVAILVWHLPLFVVLPVFAIFIALDGAFLSAALAKVPEGAWFTLMLAVLISTVFVLWRFGKEAQWAAETSDPLTASSLLTTAPYHDEDDFVGGDVDEDEFEGHTILGLGAPLIRLRSPLGDSGTPISTVPGLGIFFDKVGDPTHLPPSFVHFVRKFAARPSVIVFFHMRALPVPFVAPAERFVVCRFAGEGGEGRARIERSGPILLHNAYVVALRHGYADNVLGADLGRDLVAQLQLFIMSSSPPTPPLSSTPPTQQHQRVEPVKAPAGGEGDDREESQLAALRAACLAQTVFVLGKEALRVKKGPERATLRSVTRRALLESFLWIRENSRRKLEDMDLDVDMMVEVGFVKEI